MSSLKMSSCNLILFSKKSSIDKMEKMVKEEAEMLLKSELQGSRAEALLLEERLEKLQSVANKYEQAISDLLMNEKMDVNLKMAYIKKLAQQQKLIDPTSVQLQTAIDYFNISNEAARISTCMQAKIRFIQKVIRAKMDVILNARKEEDMLSSLPKIFANLQLLDDIVSNTTLEYTSHSGQAHGGRC